MHPAVHGSWGSFCHVTLFFFWWCIVFFTCCVIRISGVDVPGQWNVALIKSWLWLSWWHNCKSALITWQIIWYETTYLTNDRMHSHHREKPLGVFCWPGRQEGEVGKAWSCLLLHRGHCWPFDCLPMQGPESSRRGPWLQADKWASQPARQAASRIVCNLGLELEPGLGQLKLPRQIC